MKSIRIFFDEPKASSAMVADGWSPAPHQESFSHADEDDGVSIYPSDDYLPWNDINVIRVAKMYGKCYNIEAIATSNPDTRCLGFNQMIVKGDGLSYHFILTKKQEQ